MWKIMSYHARKGAGKKHSHRDQGDGVLPKANNCTGSRALTCTLHHHANLKSRWHAAFNREDETIDRAKVPKMKQAKCQNRHHHELHTADTYDGLPISGLWYRPQSRAETQKQHCMRALRYICTCLLDKCQWTTKQCTLDSSEGNGESNKRGTDISVEQGSL
eukprot:gnl/TRDRNA2_/TRDRNA2_154419_c0_seq3.p1 gnl/TRDRNA2_/TRDRNA2_154419_c0~~gnl/TRDRNA2_/TRDRNA2_154419_c0_seq3.p1  ORF type:complete len:162 (-),score=17.60 gnl/TRDRNA2_/TRDRNA2_154419_c0_seq3:133-618(-)